MQELTVQMFIDAFIDKYSYDDDDAEDFCESEFIDRVRERINEIQQLEEEITEDNMAEIIHDILHKMQYGDTSDVNDIHKEESDMRRRFPNGR